MVNLNHIEQEAKANIIIIIIMVSEAKVKQGPLLVLEFALRRINLAGLNLLKIQCLFRMTKK